LDSLPKQHSETVVIMEGLVEGVDVSPSPGSTRAHQQTVQFTAKEPDIKLQNLSSHIDLQTPVCLQRT